MVPVAWANAVDDKDVSAIATTAAVRLANRVITGTPPCGPSKALPVLLQCILQSPRQPRVRAPPESAHRVFPPRCQRPAIRYSRVPPLVAGRHMSYLILLVTYSLGQIALGIWIGRRVRTTSSSGGEYSIHRTAGTRHACATYGTPAPQHCDLGGRRG